MERCLFRQNAPYLERSEVENLPADRENALLLLLLEAVGDVHRVRDMGMKDGLTEVEHCSMDL